jgi:hypothetical protein
VKRLAAWGLAIGLAAPWAAADEPGVARPEPKKDDLRTAEEPAPPAEAPTYRPPLRGKPRARVAGGVRGVGRGLPRIQVLTPPHTGRTVSSTPSFFWHLDRPLPPGADLVFTLVDEAGVEPLVEAPLEAPAGPGIQRIDLADYGVSLARGVEYEWSVVVVVDPDRRSLDVVSTGWVDRVEAPEPFEDGAPSAAHAYAAHGIWYDALAAASDRIEADPDDAGALAWRDALLRQVGLDRATSGAARR